MLKREEIVKTAPLYKVAYLIALLSSLLPSAFVYAGKTNSNQETSVLKIQLSSKEGKVGKTHNGLTTLTLTEPKIKVTFIDVKTHIPLLENNFSAPHFIFFWNAVINTVKDHKTNATISYNSHSVPLKLEQASHISKGIQFLVTLDKETELPIKASNMTVDIDNLKNDKFCQFCLLNACAGCYVYKFYK